MSDVYFTYLDLLKAAIWGDRELMSERVNEFTNGRSSDVNRLATFQGTGP